MVQESSHLGPGGYYAFYFRGPDRLKFEIVHMADGGAELPAHGRRARTRVRADDAIPRAQRRSASSI